MREALATEVADIGVVVTEQDRAAGREYDADVRDLGGAREGVRAGIGRVGHGGYARVLVDVDGDWEASDEGGGVGAWLLCLGWRGREGGGGRAFSGRRGRLRDRRFLRIV